MDILILTDFAWVSLIKVHYAFSQAWVGEEVIGVIIKPRSKLNISYKDRNNFCFFFY